MPENFLIKNRTYISKTLFICFNLELFSWIGSKFSSSCPSNNCLVISKISCSCFGFFNFRHPSSGPSCLLNNSTNLKKAPRKEKVYYNNKRLELITKDNPNPNRWRFINQELLHVFLMVLITLHKRMKFSINPLQPGVASLYPLKTSEHHFCALSVGEMKMNSGRKSIWNLRG